MSGVVGIALVVGSGSPAFTGMSYVSRIHCSDGSFVPPRPGVPRPRRATVADGLSVSLPVIVREAFLGPTEAGSKTTWSCSDDPAATVAGSVGR